MAYLLAVVAPRLLLDIGQGHLRPEGLLVSPVPAVTKPRFVKATTGPALLQSFSVPLVFAGTLAFAFALALVTVHLVEGAAEVVVDEVKRVHLVKHLGQLLGENHLHLALHVVIGDQIVEVVVGHLRSKSVLLLVVAVSFLVFFKIVAAAVPRRRFLNQAVAKDLANGRLQHLNVDGAVGDHLQALLLVLGEVAMLQHQVANQVPSSFVFEEIHAKAAQLREGDPLIVQVGREKLPSIASSSEQCLIKGIF